jgi:hypothetical protein
MSDLNPWITILSSTISTWLDALGGTQGDVLYRGNTAWAALAPGTSGQVLQSGGAGANPSWASVSGTGTVTSVGSGTGLTGGPITGTGTLALSTPVSVANGGTGQTTYTDGQLLIGDSSSGGLDKATLTAGTGITVTNGHGTITIASTSSGGTVTSVGSGAGLTGGPITGSGTLSLAAIADGDVLANTSGASAAPIATTVSALLDHALGSAQGDILYRSGTAWTVLAPGTSGQFLQTQGSSANPQWAAGNSGTVTSVAAGTGLAGGTITSTGTLSLASIANNNLLANTSGSSAAPVATGLGALIDSAVGSTRGAILERGASGWALLAPGTSGYVLTSQGTGADPAWVAEPYVISGFYSGVPGNSQLLLVHQCAKAITFPANFGSTNSGAASKAGCTVNATGSTVINIDKCLAANDPTSSGNWSTIGTLTIAASGHSATLATTGGSAQSCAQGDFVRAIGPASADATAANIFVTLAADR